MDLFEQLTDVDKSLIESYIDTYAGVEGDEMSNYCNRIASLSYLLRVWSENKVDLYNKFNNNFILEKEIEYNQSVAEREKIVKQIISEDKDNFVYLYKEKISELSSLQSDYNLYYNFINLLDSYYLAETKYGGESFTFYLGDKKVVCQCGCRPIRILGKIAKFYNLDKEFDKFSVRISMANNQRHLKGKLCLSIHPLDYMTMSDNDIPWDSCMSWMNGGSYRRGTVEMMNSKNVVVAYLRSSEDMDLNLGRETYWNNKKWRSLFIVDERAIVSVKAYPYQNYELTKIVLAWLKELCGTEKYGDLVSNFPVKTLFAPFGYEKKLYFRAETNAMYNDFGLKVEHYGYFNLDLFKTNSEEVKLVIDYSGPSECMCCGSIDEDFASEQDLVCMECNPETCCEDCGCHISEEESYTLDGLTLCEDCYNERVRIDSLTDEEHLNTYMTNIYVIRDNDDLNYFYRNPSFEVYRETPLSEGTMFYYFNGISNIHPYDGDYYVYLNDLTQEAKNVYYDINCCSINKEW